jgi:two-component system, LuxR family, sensor kinase FixL
VHRNLSQVKGLEHNEDFRALNTLIQSLENVSTVGLKSARAASATGVELTTVLDEVRILIDAAYRDSAIQVEWRIPERLGVAWADRYGLVQVFLNLAKNSYRAMQTADTKLLRVTAAEEANAVVIRFEDTGIGVRTPETLFRPFQRSAEATGLGLFVSRAVMRSFGGDLVHEPRTQGCCFAVVVPLQTAVAEPHG